MISVVVPLHNEERSIGLLHEELQAALDPLGEEWEAVYVDDGSTDGSFSALTRLHAREDLAQRLLEREQGRHRERILGP